MPHGDSASHEGQLSVSFHPSHHTAAVPLRCDCPIVPKTCVVKASLGCGGMHQYSNVQARLALLSAS